MEGLQAMSNGDDVLDNWEDLDDVLLHSMVEKVQISNSQNDNPIANKSPKKNCLSNCENNCNNSSNRQTDLPTSAVSVAASNKTVTMKLLQRTSLPDSAASSTSKKPADTSPTKSPLENMTAAFQPVMMMLHQPADEYQSANYTAPTSNQTVKILRRPTTATEKRDNGVRPKQPLKSLKQREQEYAEARLRILGSAKNPDDDSVLTDNQMENDVSLALDSEIPIVSTNVANNNGTHVATKVNPSQRIQNVTINYNNYFNPMPIGPPSQQQLQQQQLPRQFQPNHLFTPTNYYFSLQQQQQQQQQHQAQQLRPLNIPLLGQSPHGPIGQPLPYHQPSVVQHKTLHQQQQQQKHHKQHQQQQQQFFWSPMSSSVTTLRQAVQQSQQQQDGVLRLPRGPDGSVGFQVRR